MGNTISIGLYKKKNSNTLLKPLIETEIREGELFTVITSSYYAGALSGESEKKFAVIDMDVLSMNETVEYNLIPRFLGWRSGDEKILMKRRMLEVLKIVHLEGTRHYKLNTLGGKQLYRVAVAKALMSEPDVLIVNELFRKEESVLRTQMVCELKRLHKKTGLTMVYCTNEDWEALRISDRIAVMNGDKIEQTGTPAVIYNEPVSCYAAARIDVNNIFDAYIHDIKNGTATVYTESGWFRLSIPENSMEAGEQIYAVIRPEKVHLVLAEPAEIHMKGVLREYSFAGPCYEASVRLPNGHIVTARTLTDEIPVGTKVYIDFAPEDCRLITSASDSIYAQIEELSVKVGNSLRVSVD